MIFAELDYLVHYDDMHEPIVRCMKSHFEKVESGHQGDSWIWIFAGENKVAIDTFSSMKHQVKSTKSNTNLISEVLGVLIKNFKVNVYTNPELEPHEDFD